MGSTELDPDEPANKANVPVWVFGGPKLRHAGSETRAVGTDLAVHAQWLRAS